MDHPPADNNMYSFKTGIKLLQLYVNFQKWCFQFRRIKMVTFYSVLTNIVVSQKEVSRGRVSIFTYKEIYINFQVWA
jgi:hypothetical protein